MRHAEIIERRQTPAGTFLECRIYDDDPAVGDLGNVLVPDGTPSDVKIALRLEVQRLSALPVGKIIDLS